MISKYRIHLLTLPLQLFFAALLFFPHDTVAQVFVSHGEEYDFGEILVGDTASTQILVINHGNQAEELDIRLVEPHPGFWLTGTQGSLALQPNDSVYFMVYFAPPDSIPYETTLLIGEGVPELEVSGTGRGPRFSFYVQPMVEFEEIAIGTSRVFNLPVYNTGDIAFEIHPQLLEEVPYFSLESPLEPTIVHPDSHQNVTFLYAPEEVQNFQVGLDMGAVVHQILLRGSSREPLVNWNIFPSLLYMGILHPGEFRNKDLRIYNSGDLPISGFAEFVGEHEGFEFLNEAVPFYLEPGESHQEYFQFVPTEAGSFSAWMTFGEQYGTVELIGICEIDYYPCRVTPIELDFGSVAVGRTEQLTFEVWNMSMDDPLEIAPALESSHFSIQASPRILFPRGVASFTVDYHPQASGHHEATLIISQDVCHDVALVGSGGVNEDHCQVVPDTLHFGPVSLGSSVTQVVTIRNIGEEDLILMPSFDSPAFSFAGGNASLTTGSSTSYAVTFEPNEPGTTTAMFDLGGICRPVVCIGTAVSGFEPHQNQVGVYFDHDFTHSQVDTEIPNQLVTGYLVFHHPSEDSGVGAYELRAELTGAGIILQWDLEGDTLNIGEGNELIVGVGGSPLQPDANGNILLATLQVMVIDPFPSEVTLQLGPVDQPSLPGLMAWIPWHDGTMLVPLLPATGLQTACWINPNPVSAVSILAPQVHVEGGQAILEWSAPDGFTVEDGFHVYRRVDEGEEDRLTEDPLAAGSGRMSFVDRISAFKSSTRLSYSYALVENGAETLHSPETEIRLSHVPAKHTRLVANIPNPFNPSTEVQFELSQSGHTQISVYDINGRLICNLVDERMEAGNHVCVWNGRDGAGRPVSSGTYYLRLVTPDAVDHHKVMLLK